MDKYDYMRDQLEKRFGNLDDISIALKDKCLCDFLDWAKTKYHDYEVINKLDASLLMREWVAHGKHRGEYERKYNDEFKSKPCSTCVFIFEDFCLNKLQVANASGKACESYSDLFGELYDLIMRLSI